MGQAQKYFLRFDFRFLIKFSSFLLLKGIQLHQDALKVVFKSNERSEYSYIGLADFFLRKKSKICSRSILIFRGLTCDFFLSSVHFSCYKEGKLHY